MLPAGSQLYRELVGNQKSVLKRHLVKITPPSNEHKENLGNGDTAQILLNHCGTASGLCWHTSSGRFTTLLFCYFNDSKKFMLNISLVTDFIKEKKIENKKNNPIFGVVKNTFFFPRAMKIHCRTLKMKLNPRDSNGKWGQQQCFNSARI